MSFFYLCPVKGDITVHLLEIIVTKRIEFLKALYLKNQKIFNEYVIEGSLYDVVGHFTLLIIYRIRDNREQTDFYLKAEEKLFRQRLDSLSAYELRRFARHLLKSIRKFEINISFFEPLRLLLQHINIKKIAQHMTICCQKCSVYNIQVNFKHCFELVAKRQVTLNNGIATIPCSYFKLYLSQLFSLCLKHKINSLNTDILKNDPRIIDICNKIIEPVNIFKEVHKKNILKSIDVDIQSQFFPPCMLNLHHNLREKHRLTHNQRFSYSLFLKDAGMPVEEAIIFWKNEYEKSPNGKHSCCHSWEKDEKKFLYGIRHLYGLEGARKNYISRNCQLIQSNNLCSEGGCPFKSFEDDNMVEILNIEESHPILSEIKKKRIQGNYMSACQKYFQVKYPYNRCNDLNYNFTPLKFYFEAMKDEVGDFVL